MEVITLTGNPKSTNHCYKYRCAGNFPRMYMTAEGKGIKKDYCYQAKSQWRKKPIEGDIAVYIDIYFGDKRKRDIDNYNKLLLDSLTGVLWVDDVQIQEMMITKGYDKKNPRIELKLSQL